MTPVVICVCAEAQTAKAKMRRRPSEILKKYREGLRIQGGRIIFLQSAWVKNRSNVWPLWCSRRKREWLGHGLPELSGARVAPRLGSADVNETRARVSMKMKLTPRTKVRAHELRLKYVSFKFQVESSKFKVEGGERALNF